MRDSHLELNAVCEHGDDERPTTHVYTVRKPEAVLPVNVLSVGATNQVIVLCGRR